MTLAYPLALLFIPLLVFLARTKNHDSSINYSDINGLESLSPTLRLRLRKPTLGFLSLASLFLLSVAASRPQKITDLSMPSKTRDIFLVLDVSGSMDTMDYFIGNQAVSRLSAVKYVLSEFIKSRSKERLGLVVFGDRAFLQVPLTLDTQLISQMLDNLRVGVAGRNTAIGEGIGLAIKRLREIEGESKTIILLTDGENNAGAVNPIQAATIARDLNIKIHSIGIGGSSTSKGLFGLMQQQAEYDEDTLKQISEITSGVFFNANNLEGLQDIYTEINKLQERQSEEPQQQVVEELFFPFLTYGTCACLLYLLLGNSIFMKVP